MQVINAYMSLLALRSKFRWEKHAAKKQKVETGCTDTDEVEAPESEVEDSESEEANGKSIGIPVERFGTIKVVTSASRAANEQGVKILLSAPAVHREDPQTSSQTGGQGGGSMRDEEEDEGQKDLEEAEVERRDEEEEKGGINLGQLERSTSRAGGAEGDASIEEREQQGEEGGIEGKDDELPKEDASIEEGGQQGEEGEIEGKDAELPKEDASIEEGGQHGEEGEIEGKDAELPKRAAFFSSFFYALLRNAKGGYKYENVKRWSRNKVEATFLNAHMLKQCS
jgi:hypothetical protein